MPIHTLKQLYTAIVQPHFDYGYMVYNSASGTNKTRFQKLQTRAARLITGSDPHTLQSLHVYNTEEIPINV